MSVNPEQLSVLYQFCGAGDMRGGVQDAVNTMGGYMKNAGHDIDVFIGTADDPDQVAVNFSNFAEHQRSVLGGGNHYTSENGSQNPLGDVVMPGFIKQAFSEVGPDLVHIQAPWMPHIGGLVLGAARRADVPAIATWHIHSEERKVNAALHASRVINHGVIKNLAAMIAVSQPAEDHMRKTYKYDGPVHQIPNSIDVPAFANAKPFETDKLFKGYDPGNNFIISFVGRPDPRKGLGELLQATASLRKKQPDIQLVIGGNGPELDEYRKLARELGVADIAYFLGEISNEAKARLFASSDIAALPAMYGESQGIVLLEAMAAGARVVIGGDNPGYRSVLGEIDASDIVLVDPRNSGKFAKTMAAALDPTLRANIFEQQQKLVQKYDTAVVGQRILDLYKSIV